MTHRSLILKRNRGWPAPESSYGLDQLYGKQGWCRSCGRPNVAQRGNLLLRQRGLPLVGAWVPHWQYDFICVDSATAAVLHARFGVETRPVLSSDGSTAGAQLLLSESNTHWFDRSLLTAAAAARHGLSGSICHACDRWRWMPVSHAELAAAMTLPTTLEAPVSASSEWFGDGLKSYREVLVRNDVADFLVRRSPKDFQ